jgi:predicted  nucleic acid-binding Zn-ribbon protein
MTDAQALLDLTKADLALLRQKKQLEGLPQRAKLLELRTKRAEVQAKAQQVAAMRRESEQAGKALADEEASLKERSAEAQAKIDETSNYKEVTALSREIEGFARRLEKLEFEALTQMERLDKIATVEAQVQAALEKLAHQDAELLSSYQADGVALQKEQRATQQLREQLAELLAPELLKRYEKTREAKGGVGAAHLEGSHCSACRVDLSEGQKAKLKAGPKIGECPYCHRLLVMED